MTAREMAISYVNGNISETRTNLKKASKMKVLEFIVCLTEESRADHETALFYAIRLLEE